MVFNVKYQTHLKILNKILFIFIKIKFMLNISFKY